MANGIYDINEFGKKVARIHRIMPRHILLADLLLENPKARRKELADKTGYYQNWISRILSSPVFQDYLRKRKLEMLTPGERRDLKHKMKSIMIQSAEVLQRKMTEEDSVEAAVGALRESKLLFGKMK